MKAVSQILIFSLLLVALGCGKENESGKSGGYCMQYGYNGQCNQYSSSLGSWQNYNLGSIVNNIPCMYGRQQVSGVAMTQGRTQQGQLYMGVTSLGDVLIIQGNGTNNPQYTMVLCGSTGMMNGGSQLTVNIGGYATCGRIIPAFATVNTGYFPKYFRDAKDGINGQFLPVCSQY